jgi:polyketide synthase 12/epothilone polyketide synthase D
MASLLDRRDRRRIVSTGIEFIRREKGLNILAKLLQRSCAGIEKGSAQVVVLPINWREFFRLSPKAARIPLFADIAKEQASEVDGQAEPGLTKAALLEADPKEHQGLLESYLAELVARELMIPLPKLDITQPLPTLGFDSLMAVAVRNRIERELEITLPMVRLLEGHSVSMLATHLCDQLNARFQNGVFDREVAIRGTGEDVLDIVGDLGPKEALSLLEKIDELSDDQVNAILKKIAST